MKPTIQTGLRRRSFNILLSLLAVGCGAAPTPRIDNQERAVTQRVLIAMTSHDRKGDTGEATGAYLPEIAHPYAVFVAAGFSVDFASVQGGRVPLDGADSKDPESALFLEGGQLAGRLHNSLPSNAVDAKRYDAIFFAGGHGAMWDLPNDVPFARAAASIYERGGVVGAVCHGPAALVNVKLSSGQYLVAGHDLSAFSNEEERTVKLDRVVPFLLQDQLVARGAVYQEAPLWQSKVVASQRLVTGQNPASAKAVAEAIVHELKSKR